MLYGSLEPVLEEHFLLHYLQLPASVPGYVENKTFYKHMQ